MIITLKGSRMSDIGSIIFSKNEKTNSWDDLVNLKIGTSKKLNMKYVINKIKRKKLNEEINSNDEGNVFFISLRKILLQYFFLENN